MKDVVDSNNNNNNTTTTTTTTTNTTTITASTTKNDTTGTSTSTANESSNKDGKTGAQPTPLLKGTLSYNLELRRHVLRGMWDYENHSNAFHPQRFELIRNLGSDEKVEELPQNGEFHGSFSLTYIHKTSKGKQRERSKVISESGVQITFTPTSSDNKKSFNVHGEGTNQFGIFIIQGTATKSTHEGDPTYDVELRKTYKPTSQQQQQPISAVVETPLPNPSPSYPSNVVCLKGLLKTSTESIDIKGMWSSGLDLIQQDPMNQKGLCNPFEYVKKSTTDKSGKYAGWFHLTTDDGTKTKVNEKDVLLKFKKNNAGYFNVEGRGSNAFGKYSISGTHQPSTGDITLFRHFQTRKPKKSNNNNNNAPTLPTSTSTVTPTTATATATNTNNNINAAETAAGNEVPLTLEDVKIEGEEEGVVLEAIAPPAHGEYSAVHRGVLRINEDGAHTCSGKWAITREHFNNNCTSNFHFGLEAHHATLAAQAMVGEKETTEDPPSVKTTTTTVSPVPPKTLGNTTFPVDSASYKGSFKMKRGTTKFHSIIDKQIVLKFRKNTSGSYNVYGQGKNSIGPFSLIGTVIILGKGSGQVELYRIYPLTNTPAATTTITTTSSSTTMNKTSVSSVNKGGGTLTTSSSNGSVSSVMPMGRILPSSITPTRKESSRQRKLPMRLEDESATMARMMEKCASLLKLIKEKDVMMGNFFGEPVDPVAQGIPNYPDIISHPMDLGTISQKFDDLTSPLDFAHHVRLVFENAMKFNIDSTHVVHCAARDLLAIFNQKFRDIERMFPNHSSKNNNNKRKDGSNSSIVSAKRSKKEETSKSNHPWMELIHNTQNTLEQLSNTTNNSNSNAAVTQKDFSTVVDTMKQMQQQIIQMQTMFLSLMNNNNSHTMLKELQLLQESNNTPTTTTTSTSKSSSSQSSRRKSTSSSSNNNKNNNKSKNNNNASSSSSSSNNNNNNNNKKRKQPPPEEDVMDKPLTLKEQEELTEAINSIDPEKLETIIQIIRESATLNDDEDEIDLEIDQLDTRTQRKLQRFVMKVRPYNRHTNIIVLYVTYCMSADEKTKFRKKIFTSETEIDKQ